MTTSDETPHEGPAADGGASRGDNTPPADTRGAGGPGGGSGAGTPASPQHVAQARIIIEKWGDVVNQPEGWQRNGVDAFYRENHMLVRDEYRDRMVEVLEPAEGDTPLPEDRSRTVGITAGVNLVQTSLSTLRALDLAVGNFGVGVAAPDYLLSVSPGGHCAASEPERVPAWADPDPGPSADHAAGEGVRVVVVDTGLDPDAPATHTWMKGVTGEPDSGATGGVEYSAGHGTFVAGIVRCIAPAADVVVKSILNVAGTTFESDMITALERVLAEDHPDVISMSAGSSTLPGVGMLGLEQFFETHLRPHKGVVLVAAAGNNGIRRPFYPAASPWAVGVGALAVNRRSRAGYSNFGGWVDVYAPGTDIVNAFPKGIYTYLETKNRKPPSETFEGMARWSGTSFATPIFAGMVAARMSKTGENGTTAAAALLAKAREGMVPGTGPVLLP